MGARGQLVQDVGRNRWKVYFFKSKRTVAFLTTSLEPVEDYPSSVQQVPAAAAQEDPQSPPWQPTPGDKVQLLPGVPTTVVDKLALGKLVKNLGNGKWTVKFDGPNIPIHMEIKSLKLVAKRPRHLPSPPKPAARQAPAMHGATRPRAYTPAL